MRLTMHRLAGAMLIGGLAILGPAHAGLGQADTSPACCQLTTTLAHEALKGGDLTGDERFFSTEGAPPNIHFLIDNSGSMTELPQHDRIGTQDRCGNTTLNDLLIAKAWDKNRMYPIPDPGTGLGSDNGFPNLFKDDSVYRYRSWGDSTSPTPSFSPGTNSAARRACFDLHPYPGGGLNDKDAVPTLDFNACVTCLTDKGFYRKPGTWSEATYSDMLNSYSNFVFTGRFLNFNPPKNVAARAVLKNVIKDLRRVRAGYTTFSTSDTGGELRQPQNPSCEQIAKDGASWDSNRASYVNDINGIAFNTNTPLAETLLNIGQHFSSTDSVYT